MMADDEVDAPAEVAPKSDAEQARIREIQERLRSETSNYHRDMGRRRVRR